MIVEKFRRVDGKKDGEVNHDVSSCLTNIEASIKTSNNSVAERKGSMVVFKD